MLKLFRLRSIGSVNSKYPRNEVYSKNPLQATSMFSSMHLMINLVPRSHSVLIYQCSSILFQGKHKLKTVRNKSPNKGPSQTPRHACIKWLRTFLTELLTDGAFWSPESLFALCWLGTCSSCTGSAG